MFFKRKVILVSVLCFFFIEVNCFSNENDDYSLSKKLDSIENSMDKIIENNSKYQGDIKKQMDIDLLSSQFIEKVNKIEDYDTKKKIYNYQIKKITEDYIQHTEKHHFYLKGFVSSLGYGTDVSYYYQNFIGVGFIFDYQSALFSDVIDKFLGFYGSLTNDNFSDYEIYKLNLHSQTYALYGSIRPWHNNFHFDLGLSVSQIKASGYITSMITTDVYEKQLVIDNFSPRPYFNMGCDFMFHDIVFALDVGILMFKKVNNEKTESELIDIAVQNNLLASANEYIREQQGFFDDGRRNNFYIQQPNLSVVNPYIRISIGYRYNI